MRSSTPRELTTVAPSTKAPAQHARKRQFAPVRSVDGAQRLRQSRTVILDLKALARVGNARRFMAERLQKPGDPVAASRRTHQHWHDVPLAQFARQVIEHEVLRRLDIADQLLH